MSEYPKKDGLEGENDDEPLPNSTLSQEELKKAYTVNKLIDLRLLTTELASQASKEDIEHWVANFNALFEKTEVSIKENDLEFRDGYPSDELFITIRSGDQSTTAKVKIIEYFDEEELLRKKMQSIQNKSQELSPMRNRATTYRHGMEKMFKGVITFGDSLGNKKPSTSSIEARVPPDTKEVAIMKAIGDITQGYLNNFEHFQKEAQREADQMKSFALEILRSHQHIKDSVEAGQRMYEKSWRRIGRYQEEQYKLEVGNLLLAACDIFSLNFKPDAQLMMYHTFDALVAIFGPKDIIRFQKMYVTAASRFVGEDLSTKDDEGGAPENILLQGCRMAEVGGDHVQTFEHYYGAAVSYQKRDYKYNEFGGIKPGEKQITLQNYEEFYPGDYDITMSRQVMDGGSGVGAGFSDTAKGSEDLLAAFANMTRKDGISIHQGGAVPQDERVLAFIGFEHIFTFETKPDPTHLFLKVSDKKITPEMLRTFK